MAIGLGSLIGKKPGEIDIGKEDTGLLTGRLSRLGELSIPTQDQPRLTENLDEMGLLDLTIQDVSQESLQDQLQQQLQETQQLQQQETRLDTMQETMLRQQRVKDIDRGIRYPRPPRPVDKTKIPRIPRVPKKEEPTDEKTRGAPMEKGSYHVEVKERGMYGGEVRKGIKFKRVTRNPLTRSDAMSLGAEITDTGSAVSFRLRRAKEKPSKLSKPVKDYTQRSYKFTKKNDVFIEKPSYRMDTPGELQEVSALGQQARRTGTFISNTTGHHRNRKQKKTGLDLLFLKTPSTRSTRRLSRNIKETGLFKKKKGDKKDAYY